MTVAEAAPVQNQAAAQKLLQKMNKQNWGDSPARGRKYRGKGKQEEAVYTMEEWERKKASSKSSMKDEPPYVSQDEDLAWQLQNQFDLEDNVSFLLSFIIINMIIIKNLEIKLNCCNTNKITIYFLNKPPDPIFHFRLGFVFETLETC